MAGPPTTTNRLSIIANVTAAADPWYFNTHGTVCRPAACRMAESCKVKPAVNNIFRTRNIEA